MHFLHLTKSLQEFTVRHSPPPSGSTLSRLVLIVLKCHIWRINFYMGPHTWYLQGTFNADSWSELSPVWVEVLVWLLANSDLSHHPLFSPSISPLTTFATGIGSIVSPVTAGEEILPHHRVFSSLPPLSHPRTWVSPAKKSFFRSGTPSLLQATCQNFLSLLT